MAVGQHSGSATRTHSQGKGHDFGPEERKTRRDVQQRTRKTGQYPVFPTPS
jgi:hypothetical protein